MQVSQAPAVAGAYDVVGIGFGPSNLALAVALEEAPAAASVSRLFLEVKPFPVWHPGMLLEDSHIQISVLKDLATIRDPRSRFTFLNYLQVKGRLFEFLNLRDLFPSRIEFNDYLSWVAGELDHRVRYRREVVAVLPEEGAGGRVERLRIVSRDTATGASEETLAKNLVLATGGVPVLPGSLRLKPGGRAFHANEFLRRLRADYPDRRAPYRFVVVGAGQTGAELFSYLLTHYPNADVTAAIRRFSYKPVDDSHFTNEIFFPDKVDWLYSMSPDKREAVLDMCKDVNYAVVDGPLIRQIYHQLYQEKVEGRTRARIVPFVELASFEEGPERVAATFDHLLGEAPIRVEADALIIATGYVWPSDHPLLAPLSAYLERDGEGYKVDRDYRAATRDDFAPGVYLQGFAERTHGASETVLSLVAIRAGRIAEQLAASAATVPATEPAVAPLAASVA